ncbi:MAG: flagellin [Kiloniellaceae bacterium]
MPRVPTFAVHQLTLAQTLETQRRLVETQIQVASGKVSRDYVGVAIDARRLVNLEGAVTQVEGFVDNINLIEGRLQVMENNVAGAFDVAARFRELLVNALNFENASVLTLNQRAEDMIVELAGLLNVKRDDRYLFAGARTDTAPIDASILLNPNVPQVDAAEFTGQATTSGTGITGLTGIVSVKVDSGNTGDAFQLEYDSTTQNLKITNLAGGAVGQLNLGAAPAAGQTSQLTFDVGGEKVVLTIDSNFNPLTSITTATIVGNVDTTGFGVGAFGAITVTSTSGDISKIDRNVIETSGTAASATLTLSSTDGNFVATGVDLSTVNPALPVLLTNATTGATVKLVVDVTTGLNDAAVASNDTEIRLGNFLQNVAATNGTLNLTEARPGDPGYDSANPAFYKGDSTKSTVRIDVNATIEYGITAKESGFEKLFRAMFTVKTANVQAGSVDRTSLQTALGLVVEAIAEIPDVRSRIGSDRLTLEQTKARHQDFVLFTKESISQIEDVDIAGAVTRIGIEQTQLEASFMLTARLSRLTLANFLR